MPAPRAPAARYASCPGSWSRWNCGHSVGQRHVAPTSSSKRYSSRLGRSAMLSSSRTRGARESTAGRGGAGRRPLRLCPPAPTSALRTRSPRTRARSRNDLARPPSHAGKRTQRPCCHCRCGRRGRGSCRPTCTLPTQLRASPARQSGHPAAHGIALRALAGDAPGRARGREARLPHRNRSSGGSHAVYSTRPSIQTTAARFGGVPRASARMTTGGRSSPPAQALVSSISWARTSAHQRRQHTASADSFAERPCACANSGRSIARPSRRN